MTEKKETESKMTTTDNDASNTEVEQVEGPSGQIYEQEAEGTQVASEHVTEREDTEPATQASSNNARYWIIALIILLVLVLIFWIF